MAGELSLPSGSNLKTNWSLYTREGDRCFQEHLMRLQFVVSTAGSPLLYVIYMSLSHVKVAIGHFLYFTLVLFRIVSYELLCVF